MFASPALRRSASGSLQTAPDETNATLPSCRWMGSKSGGDGWGVSVFASPALRHSASGSLQTAPDETNATLPSCRPMASQPSRVVVLEERAGLGDPPFGSTWVLFSPV